MISYIIKRDGRRESFDLDKIANAVFRAAQSVGGTDAAMARDVAEKTCALYEQLHGSQEPTVEEIQDLVEKELIECGHAQTAKAYILYRYERTRDREVKSNLMKIMNELTFDSAKDSDIKRENANIDGDTAMGTMLKYGSSAAKEFYEMRVLKPEHAKAHRNGDIHIHDLDFLTLTTTCCQIDLIQLFQHGFSTGHGFLREPNDISSYSALACIAIQSNQNDQHGGQSVPNFDYAMAGGVKKTYRKRYLQNVARALELLTDIEEPQAFVKSNAAAIQQETGLIPCLANNNGYQEAEAQKLSERLTADQIATIQAFAKKNAYRETNRATYQAMEALIHNLNTMNSRAGAQVPFSSLNYGTDTSEQGRMVIRNLLLATEAGLGNGETPIFPIQIFRVKEGVNYNPGEPNYDLFKLAIRCSAKRLFPNFSFVDAPFNLQYYKEGHPETEIAYMGCRTRVMGNVYDPDREIAPRRGNLSFTSINLPRIAIEANGNVDVFFKVLQERMELVIDQLNERFRIISNKRVKNFPFLMGEGVWIDSEKLSWNDKVGEVLKHGTMTIGFIGLAEALVALRGKHHGEDEESQKLGLKIIRTMREYTDKVSAETGLNYSVIATPAEGLSGRFVRLDKQRFGIIPGVTDKGYITNSYHIHVTEHIDAFSKLAFESKFQALSPGGAISYVEVPNMQNNIPAVLEVMKFIYDNIMYAELNTKSDYCQVCGYDGEIEIVEHDGKLIWRCPNCGNTDQDKMNVARRTCGYIGTQFWNQGRTQEIKDRVLHL